MRIEIDDIDNLDYCTICGTVYSDNTTGYCPLCHLREEFTRATKVSEVVSNPSRSLEIRNTVIENIKILEKDDIKYMIQELKITLREIEE
jgi:hypothetical protein